MDPTRRKFLTGAACFIAAPAIIRVADLMAVKAWAEDVEVVDFNEGRSWLQAKIEGEAIQYERFNVGGFTARYDPTIGRWRYEECDKRGLRLHAPAIQPAGWEPDLHARKLGMGGVDGREARFLVEQKPNRVTYIAKARDALY